jgi:ribosomal protein S18 acetylase RimI-like enzyme
METVELRDARRADAPHVAWVVLAAQRSQLPRGFWDFAISDDEAECLALLEALAVTAEPHFAHCSAFLVAEVAGVPAAGLCGYFDEELGMPALGKGFAEAKARRGLSDEVLAARRSRAMTIMRVAPHHEPGAWIVEHVATRPEFRRRGLVDRLLEAILERGRARGATQADISLLIGNEPARRAYEKAGFRVVGEKRDADFEAVYGSPGTISMSRSLG